MQLSDDLAELEVYVALAQAGLVDLSGPNLRELRIALGLLAARADVIERALSVTADQLSPAREHAAVAAGIAAGKVELLAAHRVRRLPDLPQPGWTA